MWSQLTATVNLQFQQSSRLCYRRKVKHTCGLKELCSTSGLCTVRAKQAAHLELGPKSSAGLGVAPFSRHRGDVKAALTALLKRAIWWDEAAGGGVAVRPAGPEQPCTQVVLCPDTTFHAS